MYCVVAGGAPPMMLLGVDNSMHDKASGDFTMCRLTLFAPYWVDNRSGLDLLFKDGPSAKGHPLLMGAQTYFDYAPVKAPGMPVLQSYKFPCIGDMAAHHVLQHLLYNPRSLEGHFARS